MFNFKKIAFTITALALYTQTYGSINGKEENLDRLFLTHLNESLATAASVEIREKLDDGTFVTRYRKSYGTLSDTPNSKPTPLDAMYRQQSVVKSIVRIAARKLIQENRLSLNTRVFCQQSETPRNGPLTSGTDDCIIPWAGDFPILNSTPGPTDVSEYYDITVENIMDHRSGIDQSSVSINQAFSSNPSITPTIEDVIALMRLNALSNIPGSNEEYSGIAYDLLAHVIGLASSEGSFISYVRKIADNIGACKSDVRLSSPLFSGAVPGREPEYYSWDNFQGLNIFEHPDSNEPFNTYVDAPNGAISYGYQPGGGGMLMTTRAMLLFAEHFNLSTGLPRGGSSAGSTGGGGPGSTVVLRSGDPEGPTFDYAYVINGDSIGSISNQFLSDFQAILGQISVTPTSGNANAKISSKEYDTPSDISCPTWSPATTWSTPKSLATIEEPDHSIEQGEWHQYELSNLNKITLFNLSANVDLYAYRRNTTTTPHSYDYIGGSENLGREQDVLVLDSSETYHIDVVGTEAARYMVDVDYDTDDFVYQAQAEDGTFSNGSIDSNHTGFTGTGFVNTDNNQYESVSVSVNVPTTGSYNISLRLANDGAADRRMIVIVNGKLAGFLEGVTSGGDTWEIWQTETLYSVTLNAGSNTLSFFAATNDGNPNIDRIDITR